MSAETFADEFDAGRDADDAALDLVRDLLGMTVVDASAGREGEVIEPRTVRESLEWSHVDALAFDDGVSYALGMRVRTYDSTRRDLSIRVVPRSGEGETEFDDVLRAMETGGIAPRWYVFGLKTPPVVRDLSGIVIRHLFIVDAQEMWRALDAGELAFDGPTPSGKGNPNDDSEAIYVSVDDLRSAGLVEHEHHADGVEW
jgi:hypothetical protein